MSPNRDRPSPSGTILAGNGALAFAAALALLVATYGWRFATPAGQWHLDDAAGSVLVNLVLFTMFALHHSLFARAAVKARLAMVFSVTASGALYVWVSSLLFALVLLLWRPVPGVAWTAPASLSWLFVVVQCAGVAIVIDSARRLDLAEFLAIRPRAGGEQPTRAGLYGVVRHPIYLGWTVAVWSTPLMTGTRLSFAATSTAYLLVGMWFEERSLHRAMGDAYRQYVTDVRWRIVPYVY
jgi:protein-S-isoprenylcysteine O-methyltransferase Ste14